MSSFTVDQIFEMLVVEEYIISKIYSQKCIMQFPSETFVSLSFSKYLFENMT